MRLLIIGSLDGQPTSATKLAMDKGETVTHAADIAQALAVLMAAGAEIGREAILAPDSDRLDAQRGSSASIAGSVGHATLPAEQVSRALVGRTVAEVERNLILDTLKHCLGNRTHAANVLGISIRTLRNRLNEYAADGVPVPPPGGATGEPRAAA